MFLYILFSANGTNIINANSGSFSEYANSPICFSGLNTGTKTGDRSSIAHRYTHIPPERRDNNPVLAEHKARQCVGKQQNRNVREQYIYIVKYNRVQMRPETAESANSKPRNRNRGKTA